jgi:CPA2 family monovalent cation:H+ antiporter-2
VRARHRLEAYELMDLGVDHVYRQHLETSIRLGVDVLRLLGRRGHSAHRAGLQFARYDDDALAKLAPSRHDLTRHISDVREQIALQEALLTADRQHDSTAGDHAWDSQELRDALGKRA